MKLILIMDKKELIKKLSKLNVSNVVFKNNWISLVYDRHHLKNKVVKRHTSLVGNWSRKHNVVYCETDLKKEDIIPILVHETVEKYLTERYGLNVDKESHRIAEAVERNFVASRSWRAHQQRIAENGRRKK